MSPEQAIQLFDDHLVWLAKRRMINNTMLGKLSSALQTIANSLQEKTIENEAVSNVVSEYILKMKSLLLSCGLTEKGIKYCTDADIYFLEKWAYFARDKDLIFPSPKSMTVFEMTFRQLNNLARHDVNTVRDSFPPNRFW